MGLHFRIYANVLPSGMTLDQAAVIADLRRQGVQHGVLAEETRAYAATLVADGSIALGLSTRLTIRSI